MSRTTILFGPPGTGKTTTLLDEVEAALEAGVPPDKIAFVSFTRKAAHEAVDRAVARFPGTTPDDFPYFRTLHSLAFKLLGLRREEVMQTTHFRELGDALGYNFTGHYDETMERAPLYGGLGDKCMALYSLARAKDVPLDAAWRHLSLDDVPLAQAERFCRALGAYKDAYNVLDFCDFLDYVHTPLDLDLLIIDEAQDLTVQQWAFAKRIGSRAKRVIVAGDDDQAIFEWAGADLRGFLSLAGSVRVLPKSHRLPQVLWNRATRISDTIRVRKTKDWGPTSQGGAVSYLDEPDQAPLLGTGTWLMLSRNRHQTADAIRACRDQGVVYQAEGRWSNRTDSVRAVVLYEALRKGRTVSGRDAGLVARMVPGLGEFDPPQGDVTWEDISWPFDGAPPWMEVLGAMGSDEMEYIRKLRRNRESLTNPGRVIVSTIHGAKGGEADNVLLTTEMSRRVYDGWQMQPDQEARVWYVGVSRAREHLHIVRPRARRFFSL